MNRILVAIDFSAVTDEVVSIAVELGRMVDATIRILHVEDSAPYGYTPRKESAHDVGVETEFRPTQGDKLRDVHRRLSKEQIEAEYRVLTGPAPDNILAAAREFDADIIVIGAHEHGKFYRLMFGDTTDSLISRAPCPILIVPPGKDRQGPAEGRADKDPMKPSESGK